MCSLAGSRHGLEAFRRPFQHEKARFAVAMHLRVALQVVQYRRPTWQVGGCNVLIQQRGSWRLAASDNPSL